MPLHDFVCDECKVLLQDTTTKGVHKCPGCGSDMRWDIRVGIHGNYKRAIHSDSLAINPDQRSEHEQRFPNIKLDNQCRPIFDNFTAHQKYLNDCNLVKDRQKLKPKGVRIA